MTLRELGAWCGRAGSKFGRMILCVSSKFGRMILCVSSKSGRIILCAGLSVPFVLALPGCSPKDPVTATPSYHVGVKTNSSSVNSWELNREPLYTQPGVNNGRPVTLKAIPSQRGFEPNDPLAEDVYAALQADEALPTRYLTASAKDGVVVLAGTLPSPALKARAELLARRVPGVRLVRSHLTVASTPQSAP